MYTYMEYLQKCFYKSTNWNEDNIFSNINATSQAILDFPIPNGLKIDTSSKTSDYSASSFTLSNFHQINGSLAYLYSSNPLTNTMGSKDVSLQDAIAGFRIIEPMLVLRRQQQKIKQPKLNNKHSLLYGRMYFPGSALEAMVIKRLNENTQLLIKCVNHPYLEKNGTMIIYLQNNHVKYSREIIYSTNESLIGVRFLYNLGNTIAKNINPNLIPKFDNSVISIGTEVWYAARTLSPGLSTALRYSTRSTSTGKPLTMTLAINPILGHVSSTYTVKTSVASTFCSKYDFNFFSYASNLSLGFELFSYSKKRLLQQQQFQQQNPPTTYIDEQVVSTHDHIKRQPSKYKTKTFKNGKSGNTIVEEKYPSDHSSNSLKSSASKNRPVSTAFQNLVNESDFSSVIKVSTSLKDKTIKLLWEGRVKEFLVSTGARVSINPITKVPEFNKLGINFAYSF
ncbi:MDM10 [Candida pseudojiufengensis]|uniref:MDM10 n=1 Tax=Candida pseudojiufengensis TaxID=497109 RepID=UPI002224BAC4|nr:MDM10 [Candida pseudojiufengensis]KAI5959001.1 MDM10 [Candida pseudojiufengensis]